MTKSRFLLTSAMALTVACARHHAAPDPLPTVETRVQQTELHPGDAFSPPDGVFRPLVPVTDSTGGECERFRTSEGNTFVVLEMPDGKNARRVVSITVDSAGTVASYNDQRGDLKGENKEPSTQFGLNFQNDRASAVNKQPGAPMELVFGKASDFTSRPDLNVSGMIQLIKQRCGAK